MWTVNRTLEFIKCVDDLSLSDAVLVPLEQWAAGVGRIVTNRQKLLFRSTNNVFEIWEARVPDPESNRGKSGGFRLVYWIVLKEAALFLYDIEHRSALGGKNERPSDMHKAQVRLEDLKKFLIHQYENSNRPNENSGVGTAIS